MCFVIYSRYTQCRHVINSAPVHEYKCVLKNQPPCGKYLEIGPPHDTYDEPSFFWFKAPGKCRNCEIGGLSSLDQGISDAQKSYIDSMSLHSWDADPTWDKTHWLASVKWHNGDTRCYGSQFEANEVLGDDHVKRAEAEIADCRPRKLLGRDYVASLKATESDTLEDDKLSDNVKSETTDEGSAVTVLAVHRPPSPQAKVTKSSDPEVDEPNPGKVSISTTAKDYAADIPYPPKAQQYDVFNLPAEFLEYYSNDFCGCDKEHLLCLMKETGHEWLKGDVHEEFVSWLKNKNQDFLGEIVDYKQDEEGQLMDQLLTCQGQMTPSKSVISWNQDKIRQYRGEADAVEKIINDWFDEKNEQEEIEKEQEEQESLESIIKESQLPVKASIPHRKKPHNALLDDSEGIPKPKSGAKPGQGSARKDEQQFQVVPHRAHRPGKTITLDELLALDLDDL